MTMAKKTVVATQLELDFPKEKKSKLMTIKMNSSDLDALKSGMRAVGEDNASSYIRRLIHANKGGLR
jgi:predicted DNA binding CopG/RHH family protein